MTGGGEFIRFSGVAHRYGGSAGSALDGINVTFSRGSFTAIIGPNGSGKSTLARHINALLLPTMGSVTVDGMNTHDPGCVQEIRRRVGFVFQNPDNQLVGATVEEDIAFGPENLGHSPRDIRDSVREAMALVGLAGLAKRSVNTLSGGQKQQLAIAGALAMKTDCLVLDEPTSMIGPGGRKSVMDLLKKLNSTYNITLVLVTHFMDEAVFADRVLVLDRGRVFLDGSPAEVFKSGPRLSRIGLDLPGPEDLAGRLRALGLEIPGPVLTLDDLVGCICRL